MADQDELRLRIVPELDDDAVKRIKAQLDALYGQYPGSNQPAPTKPQGDPDAPARKSRLADLKAEIDLRDLLARKETIAFQKRIGEIQQEMALGRTSMQEGARLIAEQENLREQASADAVVDYQKQIALAEELNLTLSERASIERKAFFASERAKNGFTTMSGSMTTLTSNTKSANIAFANFGRIVQDAPFGLLGISNNIDPLLNSFAELKKETGGTGAALLSMGKQLIGPAGLIFLLGSALPTALLFAQKYFQDTEKESNLAADAVKRVREEFAKLSAQAAGDKGLAQVDAELKANQASLNAINGSLEKYQSNLSTILSLQNQSLQQGGLSEEQQAELNKLRQQNVALNISQLATDKAIIEASTAELDVTKAQITAQNDITSARQRYGIAVALTAQEEKKLSDERAKADKERNALLLQQFSELEPLLSLQLTFNDAIKESRDAYLAQALAIRIASQAETKAFQDKIKRETGKGREDLTDDADYNRAIAQRDALEQLNIDMLRAAGKEEQAIAAETERAKREEKMRLLKLGITDTEAINNAAALVAQEGADAELAAERAKMDARVQMGNMAANAIIGGLSAAFGQSKGIKAAEVAVQSITAAYEAFSSMQAQFAGPIGAALGTAAAAGILAKGRQSIKEIYATKPGSRGASSSGASSSPSAPSGPKFVNDMGAAGQVAGTIGPFGASMTPSISITANLDRQGLALAVRDGESDIATRQIPFAS